MYAVRERVAYEVGIFETDDGDPYLSIMTGGWSSLMVTPEQTPGYFAIILSDECGSFTVAKRVHDDRVLAHILKHL